jgi:hypothetical protein
MRLRTHKISLAVCVMINENRLYESCTVQKLSFNCNVSYDYRYRKLRRYNSPSSQTQLFKNKSLFFLKKFFLKKCLYRLFEVHFSPNACGVEVHMILNPCRKSQQHLRNSLQQNFSLAPGGCFFTTTDLLCFDTTLPEVDSNVV